MNATSNPDGRRTPVADSMQLSEERVPLEGIRDTLDDLIELYGGEVETAGEREVTFVLPVRRGVAAAGGVDCTLSWDEPDAEGLGGVRLVTLSEVGPPKLQRIALLLVGVSGAMLWILWPFFPNMGPLAWIGGVLAFATWFITARTTSAGVCGDLLNRLVKAQREPMDGST